MNHDGATPRLQNWKTFLLRLFFVLPVIGIAPASILHNGRAKIFAGVLGNCLTSGGVKDHGSPFLHIEVL